MSDQAWPIYFKDRLSVSNLDSPIAITTLWTPKDLIIKMVPSDSYCVTGQLYTKKGINFLLRNILAKPTITKMILCGSDLMGSGEALINLVKNGVDENYKIIGDELATIEKEIPLDAINAFRKNVEIIDIKGPENIKKIEQEVNKLINLKKAKPWMVPEIFPEPPKPEVSRFPAEIDLMKIRRETISEAYLSVLRHLNLFGLESEAMIGYVSETSKTMKELLNLAVVVTDEDPNNWVVPDYMPFSRKDLDKYFAGFFSPDRGTEDYTYGERLYNFANEEIKELKNIYPWLEIERFQEYFSHGGIDQVSISIVRKLSKFPYDKGAIALLSNTFKDIFPQRPPQKTPCLMLVQCQIYQNKLNLTAYFRSNDMYNAWPLNAFALRKLQFEIAQKLDVEMGSLITISNMAHIYEHNYKDAEDLANKHYKGTCEWDPRGNFHIKVEGEEVIVNLATPRGNEYIKEWRINANEPKASNKLCYKIIEEDLAAAVPGNISDLSRQIERAVISVKLGVPFEQDNQLNLSKLKKKL